MCRGAKLSLIKFAITFVLTQKEYIHKQCATIGTKWTEWFSYQLYFKYLILLVKFDLKFHNIWIRREKESWGFKNSVVTEWIFSFLMIFKFFHHRVSRISSFKAKDYFLSLIKFENNKTFFYTEKMNCREKINHIDF